MKNSQRLGSPLMHDSVSLTMASHGPYFTVHQKGRTKRWPLNALSL